MTPVEQQLASLRAQFAALATQTKEQIGELATQASEHHTAIDRMGKDVHVHEQQLRPARGAPLVNRKQADSLYGPRAMRKQLAAGGEAPLRLAGLKGAAGDVQPAAIPEVAALPQLGDSSVKVGTLVHHEGANYRRGQERWEKL